MNALTSFGSSTGGVYHTALNTYVLRTLTGTANQVSVTNGNGVSGNPILSLANAISGITSITASNIQIGVANTNIISTADLAPLTINAPLQLTPISGVASPLRWYTADGAYYEAFQGAATAAGNVTWTLPATDGGAGTVLTTNGSGALSWTSAGAGTVNSVTGTLNRITSTGGTNPIIDISASYVGQASITTVGTIGTGVWQGTPVVVGFGGTGAVTFNAYGVLFGGTTSTGIVQSVAPGTSGYILTSTGGSSLPSWQANTAAPIWTNEATNINMVANNSYFSTSSGSAVTFTIPATAAFGAEFEISGMGSAGWILQANTGQTIIFGNQSSSSTGSLSSTNRYDGVKIACSVANTDFKVLYAQGNLTVA